MSSRSSQVARLVRNWLVPMLRSMPHRVAEEVRERSHVENRRVLQRLRKRSNLDEHGRPLLARRSMGFRTFSDVRVPALHPAESATSLVVVRA